MPSQPVPAKQLTILNRTGMSLTDSVSRRPEEKKTVMPRTDVVKEHLREEQRAKILEAARRVFARKGLGRRWMLWPLKPRSVMGWPIAILPTRRPSFANLSSRLCKVVLPYYSDCRSDRGRQENACSSSFQAWWKAGASTAAGQSVVALIAAIGDLTAALIIGVNSSRNSRRVRHYAQTGELPYEIAFTSGTE